MVQNTVINVRVIITSNCILKNASTYTLFLCMRVWRSWSSNQARLCVLGWPVFEFPWQQWTLTWKLRTYYFCCSYYYWGYCHYCDYFAGKCTAWDIRIERLSSAQGPLCTIQLFGAWPHQIQWCAAGLLQPVPCETTLWQSSIGPRYDSASRYWQWCIRGHARFSLVRTGFAPFLCLRTNRHRVQIVWLCSRVDAGNIWRSWEW